MEDWYTNRENWICNNEDFSHYDTDHVMDFYWNRIDHMEPWALYLQLSGDKEGE